MRLFTCPACKERLFFENLQCACGAEVAFDPETQSFVAADRTCDNRPVIGCNWRPEVDAETLCRSCAMTEVAPDLGIEENRWHWAEVELAKRWVLAALARWGWFAATDTGARPRFHMLAETTRRGDAEVTMGHADGLITLNVSEADPATRVARREQFQEPLRTLIAHLRHELAHFFFLRFSQSPGFLAAFRALFGDEQVDYAAALQAYYDQGPKPSWCDAYITAYASSHPHEDWAESFAHLLHLTDIADSFYASGLRGGAELPPEGFDPYAVRDAELLIATGARLGIALNHVNRSMGLQDVYPFVHSNAIRAKMAFIHARLIGAT